MTCSDLKLPLRPRLMIGGGTILAALLLLALVTLQPWFDAKWMFADVLTAAREADTCCHATYGAMSQLGLFLWSGTAAVGLFTAVILFLTRGDRSWTRFSLAAGLLSGWMGLDDALLLHESILPGLGISQNLIMLLYAALALAYLITSRAIIMKSEAWLLALALAGFAASVGLDVVIVSQPEAVAIAEDAAKFFGLSLWSAYHIITFALMLTRARQHS